MNRCGTVDFVTTDFSTGWLVREGILAVWKGAERIEVNPGEWIFLPPGTRRQWAQPNARRLSIAFRFGWPGVQSPINAQLPLKFAASAEPAFERLALEILVWLKEARVDSDRHLVGQSMPMKIHLQIRARLAEWLAELITLTEKSAPLVRPAALDDSRVCQVLQWIENQPLDRPLQLAPLCAKLGLSESHLDRVFEKAVGLKIRAYFSDMRHRAARQALARQELQAKEVAAMLGFRQHSHFTRWFSKREGRTPREFSRDPRLF